MFQIYPSLSIKPKVLELDEKQLKTTDVVFQGMHIVAKVEDTVAKKAYYVDLPSGQSYLSGYLLDLDTDKVYDQKTGQEMLEHNGHSLTLAAMSKPIDREIELSVEVRKQKKEVILLNTLDSCYGHSYLTLLNIQNIYQNKPEYIGIILIIQPMFKWMVPASMVDEVWVVRMSFADQNSYFTSLNDKIHQQFSRFDKVFLSRAHLLPTADTLDMEAFVKVKPYDHSKNYEGSRITYVWRQDYGRLWIKSVLVYGACKVLRIRPILRYVHWLRVVTLFVLLRLIYGKKFKYTIAGDGDFGFLPSFIEDHRTTSYGEQVELKLAKIYSESVTIIGTHGSSMLIPSTLAGSVICLMPFMKWSHIGEDIIYQNDDARVVTLRTRYIPTNVSMIDLLKIINDLIVYYKYNIDKFVYDKNEL
jgi:hypothetical protein